MINSEKIKTLFQDLDDLLHKRDKALEIIIFGSGALLIQNISRSERRTVDVDMVFPEMNMELQIISAEVGEKHGLPIGWLNSAGFIFSRNFPRGWRSRTEQVYLGKSLIVKSLGRSDLIATKFYAYCSRGLDADLDDLRDLKPTRSELNSACEWISKIADEPDLVDRSKKLAQEFMDSQKE